MELRNLFPSLFQQILKNPTVENVITFKNFIKIHIQTICSSRQENLMLTAIFKIIAEINVPNENEIICHLIETASVILSNTHLKTEISLLTMLTILLKQIGVAPSYMFIQMNLSEELKLNIVNCFEVIFRKSTPAVTIKFYKKENLNLFAQVLSLCDHILANETYKSLRFNAVKCIISVFQVHDEADKNNYEQRQHIANVMFLLIPKIVQTLTNISVGCNAFPETLKEISIIALGRILQLIFEDHQIDSNISQQTKMAIEKSMIESSITTTISSQTNSGTLSVDDKINNVMRKERTKNWLNHASKKLIYLLEKLENLTRCKSRKMRQELFNLSVALLDRCQRNLEFCVPTLLKINIALFEFGENKQYTIYDEHLIDITEELFTQHILRLPRVIHSGSEEDIVVAFFHLKSSMSILRTMNRLQITFSNEDMIEKLLLILLTSVEQDKSNKLVEISIDITDQNDGEIINTLFLCHKNAPWKKFKHVQDSEIIQSIHSICEYIIEIQQVHTFVLEYLFQILSKNLRNANEVLIIIQMLLSNTCIQNNTSENLHCSILECLLCEYRWKLICDVFEDMDYGTEEIHYIGKGDEIAKHKISLNEIKNNILHTCLVIETVGCYAKYMQRNYRQFHLVKSLHLISEKLVCKQYMIRLSALTTMENMRSAYNLNTVSDLMQSNTDYLIHSINKSLVKPSKIDEALHILENTFNYNLKDAQIHIENIVPTIIAEGSKAGQFRNSLAFMQVFKLILTTIRNLISAGINDDDIDRPYNIEPSRNNFEVWLHILNAERVFISSSSNNNIRSSSKERSNKTIADKNTTLVGIAANILKQAIPSLSSTNVQLKMITLECISIGLDIIKEYENEMLPLVHLLWEPIVNGIVQNREPIVRNKSLHRYTIQLATKLIIYSKNFVTSRSISQFFPHIKQYFYDFSMKDAIHKQSLDEYSLDFKTLKDLLFEMPNMLMVLDFEERELEHILNSILPLHSLEQKSSSLQRQLLYFLTELSTFDICTMHLRKQLI